MPLCVLLAVVYFSCCVVVVSPPAGAKCATADIRVGSCSVAVMLLNLWRQILPVLSLSGLAISVVSIPVASISVLSHLRFPP